MLQGTGSDVGKSLLVAGLCRAYYRRGLSVRPFKPQNMSNNAAVTPDGGEIGRAQALQARAAGVAPCADMNPVLLKPQSDSGAQIVVQGRVIGNATAREYYTRKNDLLAKVMESFERLRGGADLIIAEGAGSPAEINLRDADIANMGFAVPAAVPVCLVGDISRGGVIASLIGTWHVLEARERDLIKGYLVNKFRGDISLFDGGLEAITRATALPALGVVPYFEDARALPAEDAMDLERPVETPNAPIKIAIPKLSRIANFDDFDPLAAEPDVDLRFIEAGEPLPMDADLIILPGSKATLADLSYFRRQGWDIDLAAYRRQGGAVLGICGGYQMLGRTLADPDGIEGVAGAVPGLAALDIETRLCAGKRLVEVGGRERVSGLSIRGYEMHIGATTGPDTERPMLDLSHGPDGATSADGRVSGCYVHGLFASDAFRHGYLSRLRLRPPSGLRYETSIEVTLDGLAAHLERHIDLDRVLELAC